MMPQRYKSYTLGEIVSDEQSMKVAEEQRKADIDAYVRLMHHTGQLGKLLADVITSGTVEEAEHWQRRLETFAETGRVPACDDTPESTREVQWRASI
jgi:hypothetical protein